MAEHRRNVQPSKPHGEGCKNPACFCAKARILVHWRHGLGWSLFARRPVNVSNLSRILVHVNLYPPHPGARG